jgi:hypothetical protein
MGRKFGEHAFETASDQVILENQTPARNCRNQIVFDTESEIQGTLVQTVGDKPSRESVDA